jgi:hypothetical protein
LHQAYKASYRTILRFNISWSSANVADKPSEMAQRPADCGVRSRNTQLV